MPSEKVDDDPQKFGVKCENFAQEITNVAKINFFAPRLIYHVIIIWQQNLKISNLKDQGSAKILRVFAANLYISL